MGMEMPQAFAVSTQKGGQPVPDEKLAPVGLIFFLQALRRVMHAEGLLGQAINRSRNWIS